MATDFHQLIDRNKRNSWVLIVVFVLFVAVVAGVIGSAVSGDLAHAAFIGTAAMFISLGISLISFYAGAHIVLAASGAREVRHDDDPQLFNVVEEIAIAGGLPMPRVYLIHDSAPNAFATGRDPAHGIVAITAGLRTKLTRDELQGVIAHEMSHIRNFDIRYAMLVAVMVGTVVMICDVFLRYLWWGGGRSRRSSSDRGKGGGGAQAILMLIAIVLAIVAPILAKLIQMAVSRQREYLADASAVELTRYPLGLAGALRKIAADPESLEAANRGTQHLYTVNPLRKDDDRASLWATHPPIQERINRLLALAHEYPQREEASAR